MSIAEGEGSERPGAQGSVVSFWLLATLGPVTAAVVVRGFTDSLSPVLGTIVIAAAMPAPLVAAMVVGRQGWPAVRLSIKRGLDDPRALILLPAAALAAWVVGALVLTAVLGNLAGLDAVGRIGSVGDVRANIATFLDAGAAATAEVPPVPVLVMIALVGGMIAGLTINGLLAFGEEYGWRGYLWERLGTHGRPGAIGGVGVLWGLWHAPLILISGLNYPDQRAPGVAAMIVFTVALSWPLDELRRATASAVGPAVLHGAVNGSAGVLLLVVGGNRLWAAPAGLIGALAFLPAGAAARWGRIRLGARAPGPTRSV